MPFIKATYEYTKRRKNFGRQLLFQDVPPQILDSIVSNKQEQNKYTLRNPVHQMVQATLSQSKHDANTKGVVFHEESVNHVEGGWPRDVHVFNEDHTTRYRRRIMHEENYINTVSNLAPLMKHYLDQNNAIEMYETYFYDINSQEPVEKSSIRIVNAFRDENQRPVSCVEWTNEPNPKLVAAYSYKTYLALDDNNDVPNHCYIWDTTCQNAPISKMTPDFSCWQIACSPIDPEIIIGGLENGTVNVFDIRSGENCVQSSSIYTSHEGPITSLLYSHSRTNTEFFTGSTDGQCMWWDCRDISKPLEKLMMSIRKNPGQLPTFSNSEGVSCLEFDPGLPSKFLAGTESGLILNVNKMGRDHSEKLVSYWDAHVGPIRSVHRSPCTFRMFLSCGDSSVRIWSEEVRTEPIIVTKPYRHEVTDAAWAPLRYSSYMSICAGGRFYFWDLLRKCEEPVVTLQVAEHELTRLTPHVEGHSVAIGDSKGSLHLIQLSDTLTEPGSRDKILMSQTYERQTRREHILDTRLKEIRLKLKAEEEAGATVVSEEEPAGEEDEFQEVEDQYFKIVDAELSRIEHLTPSTTSIV